MKALVKDWNSNIESNCDVNIFAACVQSTCHSNWSVEVKFEVHVYLTSNTKMFILERGVYACL